MNRRQKIIVSVTGIFLVLLLLVGLTYAYFLTRVTGNTNDTSISVTTANLALVYGDGNGVLEAANAIEPGDDILFKSGEQIVDAKTFTVKNEGNTITSYVVVIEDVNVFWTAAGITTDENGDKISYNAGDATTFKTNDFVYTLTCTSDKENSECNGIEKEVTFPITGGYLVLNDIGVDETQTYSLKMKYVDTGIDQSADMNKTFTAKVNIENVVENNPYRGKTNTLAYNIVNNAENVTAEEKTLGYAELVATPPTSVANEVSGANESVISVAQDDFGVSYYYRGNVTNNYVNFAGMCWKAVRIDGSGNAKLILEDQYAECDDTETNDKNSDGVVYTGNWSLGEGLYGKKTLNEVTAEVEVIDEETGETTTQLVTKSNLIVHNFYQDYNLSNSNTIRAKLINFQDNEELKKHHDKLVSGNWCSGDDIYIYSKNEEGTVIGHEILDKITDLDNDGIADLLQIRYVQDTTINYNSYFRLYNTKTYNNNEHIPMLKCDGTMYEYLDVDKTIPMYVGAITADETVYAGSVYYRDKNKQQENNTLYLTSSLSYATLSLAQYKEGYDRNIYFNNKGILNAISVNAFQGNYGKQNVRPMITLKLNNVVTGGTGTIADPYVIK